MATITLATSELDREHKAALTWDSETGDYKVLYGRGIREFGTYTAAVESFGNCVAHAMSCCPQLDTGGL